MLSFVMLSVVMLSVVMLSVSYDECCGSLKMSPSFFNLSLEYLHEVKSLPEFKLTKFCLPLFTHCPNKLVGFSHRDKTRVQMPAKIFPQLKVKC
jgi:hypothetical protein